MFKRLFMVLVVFLALAWTAQPSEAVKSINIQQATISVTGDPGTILTSNLTVENAGTEILNVVFSSTSLSNGTNSFDGPTIGAITGLNPGGVETSNFNINIPANQIAGTYTGTINASAGEVSDTATLEVIVNAVPSMELNSSELTGTIAQGFSKVFKVTITNTGNSALDNVVVSFSNLTKGSDTIDSSNIAISENGFQLGIGESKQLSITVVVPSDAPIGTYQSTFDVASGSINLNGTLEITVQQPVAHISVPSQLLVDDVVRGREYSKVFTLANDGDLDLSDIQVITTATASYEVTFSSVPTALAKGSSNQVMVNFKVPEDEASGEHTIGDIKVITDKYNTSFPLKVNPKVMLELYDLKLYVDGTRKSVSESGGDTVKIKPGSEVQVKATMKNLYSDSDDIDINDVSLTATIYGIDDGEDMEEESDSVDIRTEHKKDLSVTFNIPWEVEQDTYELELDIEGTDDYDAEHKVDITMELEVEKESHQIIIKAFQPTKETLKCDSTEGLEVELMNIGRRDEDEVMYTVKCSNLNVDITEGAPGNYIELSSKPYDEDSKFSKTHTITLPSTISPGTYTCELRVYRNRDTLEASQTTSFTVEKCTQEAPEQPTEDHQAPITVITPTTQPVQPGPVVAKAEQGFLGLNDWVIIGLLGAIFLIALIIVILLALR